MQNGEEHRALQREIMMARAGQNSHHSPAARLLPQSFERQRRPDASRRTRCRLAGSGGVDDNGFGGEAGAERSRRSNCPLSRKSSTRPSVAMTCWRTAAFATAFDDLEIGAPARGFLRKYMTGSHGSDSL